MTGPDAVVLQAGPVQAVVRILVEGLGTAGLYVILASGLTLIFGLMGVLNFAHGALITIGTYLAIFVMLNLLPIPGLAVPYGGGYGLFLPLLVVMLFVFVVTALVGGVIEYGLVRRIYERPAIDQILLTFGISTVLLQLTNIVGDLFDGTMQNAPASVTGFTSPSVSNLGPDILRGVIDVGGFQFSGLVLFKIVLGIVVTVAVFAFLTRTRYGLYVRAGSEDDEMAEALGIDVRFVFTLVFALGSGLAGIAGMFLIWEAAGSNTVAIQLGSIGTAALLPAFVVVVVGGLGTFKGTVVASVVAGLFAELGSYISTNFVSFPTLSSMFLFLLLVAVLVFRPTGLLGEEEVGGH